ncbi:hypothetical protein ABK040_005362 [Willaertia magna]
MNIHRTDQNNENFNSNSTSSNPHYSLPNAINIGTNTATTNTSNNSFDDSIIISPSFHSYSTTIHHNSSYQQTNNSYQDIEEEVYGIHQEPITFSLRKKSAEELRNEKKRKTSNAKKKNSGTRRKDSSSTKPSNNTSNLTSSFPPTPQLTSRKTLIEDTEEEKKKNNKALQQQNNLRKKAPIRNVLNFFGSVAEEDDYSDDNSDILGEQHSNAVIHHASFDWKEDHFQRSKKKKNGPIIINDGKILTTNVTSINSSEEVSNSTSDMYDIHHNQESLSLLNKKVLSEEELQEKKHLRDKRKRRKEKQWNLLISVKKTGMFFSVWNLIMDILSPGTVSLAQTVAQSGLYMSIIWFIFFGIITIFTLCLIYELSRNHLKQSLPELAEVGLGKFGYIVTCIFIFTFNFGAVCAQYLMFSEVVPSLLAYIFGGTNMWTGRNAVLIYLTFLLIPIATMKDLGSFAFTSFVAVGCVMLVACVVAYEFIFGKRYIPHSSNAFAFIHPQILSALGTLSYIYVCHDLSFHVFTGLRRATRARYYTVVIITVTLTVITAATMGICGYLIFYDYNLREANILDLLPTNYSVAIIGRCLLTVSIGLSIPYSAFMPRNSILLIINALIPKLLATKLRREIVHYTVTFTVIFIALAIALAVTDLGVVFQITGGISACSLAYILPPFLVLRLEPGRFTLLKICSFITLLIGVAIFVCTMYSVIDGLVNGN